MNARATLPSLVCPDFPRLAAHSDAEKTRGTRLGMTLDPSALNDSELLCATKERLRSMSELDAELLVLLGEIDSRQLYATCAFPSMFAFCVGELGLSEDAACNRIAAARLVRRHPAAVEYVRKGRIHLTGLRLLAPVVTEANADEVLAAAAGKSKRDIEELVARLQPKPPVPDSIRKLPERTPPLPPPSLLPSTPEPVSDAAAPPSPAVEVPRPLAPGVVKPLCAETYKVQFTASRKLRDKLEAAKGLMRHRVPDGDLATIVDAALDVLIEKVKKERFGTTVKPRATEPDRPAGGGSTGVPLVRGTLPLTKRPATRHIPMALRREVYERDGGQCTFVSADGRRCPETGGLEFDHLDGFARVRAHSAERIVLKCRRHNQHAADELYGRPFMNSMRHRIRPGADDSSRPSAHAPPPSTAISQQQLL